MKKILFVFASAVVAVSCNDVADNEYKIIGQIDPSFNGKNVYLEKQGGFMGTMPVDTAKVEDGQFIFTDTVSRPSFHFISVEGMQPGQKARFILEEGKINIEVDKDTLYKSKVSGTYNNEKYYEYVTEELKNQKKQQEQMKAFEAKYKAEIDAARTTRDTAAFNRLGKIFLEENKDIKGRPVQFIKDNPKAYLSVILLTDLYNRRMIKTGEAKELYEKLDAEVKNLQEGKDLAKAIEEAGKPKAPAQETQAAGNAEVGQMAPQFSAPNPEGKVVSLKESMGKVTVIDFWASWCKPCRIENPNVVAMYKELHPKGLNIIGVSLDKDAAKWKEAIAADNLTWNHISNLKFWEEPIARMYGVNSIPATFVLDANGKIVAKNLRGDALKAKVEELLNAKQ